MDASRSPSQALELARAMVRIPSVNPALETGGAGESEVAALTLGWLESWGFEARLEEGAPGRCNVVGGDAAGGAAQCPALLFNGHLDTVGVSGMVVPPFGAALEDGRMIGRGSCDMKGGVAALLAAAASLAESGHPGEIQVALTADEEHASLGMQALVAGGVRADAAVVCEPTELAVMPAHKGFVWMRALFRGRAAHGSRPEIGIDAIRHAALYAAELEELGVRLSRRPAHPLLGRPSFHFGTVAGGSTPSVYPDRCELVIERRTLPGEEEAKVERDFADALDALRGRIPEVDATLEKTLSRPGTEVPVDSALVQGLLSAGAAEGTDPRVEGMTAWVDAAYLNQAGIPAVCFGPGSIARAHTDDEWAPVDEIESCASILERCAGEFLTRR